ncbi:hypothetical protein U3516DRAFT_665255 [Neocallimastix sp. 'constans']
MKISTLLTALTCAITAYSSSIPQNIPSTNIEENPQLQKLMDDYSIFHDDIVEYLAATGIESDKTLERRGAGNDLKIAAKCADSCLKLVFAPAIATCTVICIAESQ